MIKHGFRMSTTTKQTTVSFYNFYGEEKQGATLTKPSDTFQTQTFLIKGQV